MAELLATLTPRLVVVVPPVYRRTPLTTMPFTSVEGYAPIALA